ncbi:6-phosphogluconolactonase [Flavobacterium sp. CGRL2]
MIQIYNTTEEINTTAADLFADAAEKAIAAKGKFTAVLTGGSSPAGIYKLLASDAYKKQNRLEQSLYFLGRRTLGTFKRRS